MALRFIIRLVDDKTGKNYVPPKTVRIGIDAFNSEKPNYSQRADAVRTLEKVLKEMVLKAIEKGKEKGLPKEEKQEHNGFII